MEHKCKSKVTLPNWFREFELRLFESIATKLYCPYCGESNCLKKVNNKTGFLKLKCVAGICDYTLMFSEALNENERDNEIIEFNKALSKVLSITTISKSKESETLSSNKRGREVVEASSTASTHLEIKDKGNLEMDVFELELNNVDNDNEKIKRCRIDHNTATNNDNTVRNTINSNSATVEHNYEIDEIMKVMMELRKEVDALRVINQELTLKVEILENNYKNKGENSGNNSTNGTTTNKDCTGADNKKEKEFIKVRGTNINVNKSNNGSNNNVKKVNHSNINHSSDSSNTTGNTYADKVKMANNKERKSIKEMEFIKRLSEVNRDPQLFIRRYIKWNLPRKYKGDTNKKEIFQLAHKLLRHIGIDNKVKTISLIGHSVIELYVPGICLGDVESLCSLHNIELYSNDNRLENCYHHISDDMLEKKIIHRIGHLLTRTKLVNLRKVMMENLAPSIVTECLNLEKILLDSRINAGNTQK